MVTFTAFESPVSLAGSPALGAPSLLASAACCGRVRATSASKIVKYLKLTAVSLDSSMLRLKGCTMLSPFIRGDNPGEGSSDDDNELSAEPSEEG